MKDITFLRIAQDCAEESKCISLHVGAVITVGGRIKATGYNGTAAGHINCCEAMARGHFTREEHSAWSQKYEIHAEMNALLHCDERPVGGTVYVTHSPCFNCVKHLGAAGIARIVFETLYHRYEEKDVIEMLTYCDARGILVQQIDGITGSLVDLHSYNYNHEYHKGD